jgi:hypothetical protein
MVSNEPMRGRTIESSLESLDSGEAIERLVFPELDYVDPKSKTERRMDLTSRDDNKDISLYLSFHHEYESRSSTSI